MSFQSVKLDSEASSQSQDTAPGVLDLFQVSRKLKQRNNQSRAWNFQYTLSTDLLGEGGVTTYEKTNLLTKHPKTRLGHKRPHAVHSVTVLCDFESVLLPSTDVSPLIPILIMGYVRSHPMAEYGSLKIHGRQSPAAAELGRPPRCCAVHQPCREHNSALVQAFRVWRAKIEQRR